MTAFRPDESADQVLKHLAQGACVVLPTESTYELVAPALNPEAVKKAGTFQSGGNPASLVFHGPPGLLDWLPLLRGQSARLVRKMGAGPYALVADAGFRLGLWNRLPEATRATVAPSGRVAVRWPDHAIWAELARVDLPLVTVPLAGASTAADAARAAGNIAELIVDAGATQYGQPPSLIQVEGARCRLDREGALTRELFDELTVCRILFICTGNTCRSPMAQALCTRLLADRLGCAPDNLKAHGFLVQSAGLAAMMGAKASEDAVQVAQELGGDLSRHQSAMVTLEMLQWVDHVFTMTASHWYTLLSVPNSGFPEPRMLSPVHEDIADPIGGALVDYRTCAQQILENLQHRLPEILES